jgi:hypothetical protein
VAVLLFWVIGYYPFKFGPPSKLHKTGDGLGIEYVSTRVFENTGTELGPDGLHFTAPGIALSPLPPVWLAEAIEASSLGVELTIRAALKRQSGPARIFTISKNSGERNLTIGQQGSDLIIRLRRSATNPNGLPAYNIKDVFSAPGDREIGLHIDQRELRVRIDGSEVLSATLDQGALSHWSPEYLLAFGNELNFERPWLGDIYKATVTLNNRTFNYTEPGSLDIPELYSFEIAKELRANPFAFRSINRVDLYKDWVINFAGFFALGILIIYLMGPSSSVLVATVLCGALSLSIEGVQIFLVDRYPALSDLLLNTVGGLSGAWASKTILPKKVL